MFEAPTPRNKPSAPSGSLLQLPPPAVAASAIASEQAEKSANEQREAIRDEMNKRLMNIAEEQEKLRVRVSKLEAENSLKAVAPPPPSGNHRASHSSGRDNVTNHDDGGRQSTRISAASSR